MSKTTTAAPAAPDPDDKPETEAPAVSPPPMPSPFQPLLLNVPAADVVTKLEAAGEYTGERLKTQRPEVYQQVLLLLGQGHGAQFIQDKTGVSKNTVKAVRRAEGQTIDLLKTRIAENNFEFAEQADEAASLILSEIMTSSARRSVLTVKDVQALKVAAGIAVTNGQLLTGKPTANVSVELFAAPTEDLNAQLAAHIASLKDAATHIAPEKNPAKGGADLDATPASSPGRPGTPLLIEIDADRDGQSPVAAPQTTEPQL